MFISEQLGVWTIVFWVVGLESDSTPNLSKSARQVCRISTMLPTVHGMAKEKPLIRT